ncbi:hypothetical protein FNJ84_02820 [Paracoccus sp. M683]|uniref:hypothetical protein n=1 Tax=Paracoccus sp. M683 TaxID=2594268 RepID=UPI0011804044|nr:hypothetical protein [Paracoccus sp. M683]TRW99626.1 hypothetical protein FNJ84_02820 [Paracoccus sp. M683]
MNKIVTVLACVSALALAACGPNAQTRAVTGGATGLAVAGPVGAAVGAAAGGTGAVRVNP